MMFLFCFAHLILALFLSSRPRTAADLIGRTLDADGWRHLDPSADSRVVYVSSSAGDDTASIATGSTPHAAPM